ncbi:MAG: methylamine utilization protein [Betaproteobacteria bacterium]
MRTLRRPSVTRFFAAAARRAWRIFLAMPALLVLATLAAAPASAGLTAKIVDASGKPVPDAVVYAIPTAGTRVPTRTPAGVAIEQRDREFSPYVTVIQTGTTVTFPNRDPLLHHVYSFSHVKTFEIKLYSGDAPRGILFDKPGTVTLGCNIHDWMIGYILVVDTPWFAKSDSEGMARIGDIGAGEFELHAWHPTQRTEAAAKPVRLDGRSTTEVQFTLDAAPRKKRFKPPLDPVRYK